MIPDTSKVFGLGRLLPVELYPHFDDLGVDGSRLVIDGDSQRVFSGTVRLLSVVKGGVEASESFFGPGRNCSLYVDREVEGGIRLSTGDQLDSGHLRRGVVETLVTAPIDGSLEIIDGATGHGSVSIEVLRKVDDLNLRIEMRGETGVGRVKVQVHGNTPQAVTVLGLPCECQIKAPTTDHGRPTMVVLISSELTRAAREQVASEHIAHEYGKFGHPWS